VKGTITANGNTVLVDLPITLKHECTNVELAGIADILLSYQYLKDGTKTFPLVSFT
jgi:hypothetical protein